MTAIGIGAGRRESGVQERLATDASATPWARATTCAFLFAVALLSRAGVAAAQAPGAQLVRLVVSPASTVVRAGRTAALKALGDYDDGTLGVDVTPSVSWSSTNDAIASVSSGVATGVSAGTTTIRATHDASGIQSDPATGALRVVATLKKIALSPTERILPIKRTTLFHAIGTFEQGVLLEVSKDVTFASLDTSIATITASGRARGKAVGKVGISATDGQTGIGTSVEMTVLGKLEGIAIAPGDLALAVGGTALLKAKGSFAGDCHTYNYGSRLAWSSSSPAIATIDNEGNLSCVSDGVATIAARDRPSGITSTQSGDDETVICGGSPLAIVVKPRKDVVPVGSERDLAATYVFAGGVEADGTRQVLWSSNQPGIAKILVASGGSVGEAEGVLPGRAVITAFDAQHNLSSADPGGRNGVIRVPGAPTTVDILPTVPGASFGGDPGTALRLTAQVGFADGSSRAMSKLVAWSSSNPAVVAIDDGSTCAPAGTVQLVSLGSASVSATYPKSGGPGSITASVEIQVGPIGSASRAFVDPPTTLLD